MAKVYVADDEKNIRDFQLGLMIILPNHFHP